MRTFGRRRLVLALAAASALLGEAGVPARAQGLDLSQGGAIDVTARDGLELRQNDRMVIATGDARAVRGGVTVTADRLIALYRPKSAATAVSASAGPPPGGKPPSGVGGDTGSNEIYRLEAEGNVHIFTATDLAVADKAVYDIDQAVLVLTGKNLTITTPSQVLTARDTMEYWSQKRMSVGRGLATVTTSDGRRITADILVGYSAAPSSSQAPTGGAPVTPGKPPRDAQGASGKLERVEGFGNVEVRTQTDIVKGDRGIYVADTGIARLAGHVRLTRGQNQLEGDEALVNMRTGISTLVRDPGGRVQGLVIPNDSGAAGTNAGTPKPRGGAAPSTPAPKR